MNIESELNDLEQVIKSLEALPNLDDLMNKIVVKATSEMSEEDKKITLSFMAQARDKDVNQEELLARCSKMFNDKLKANGNGNKD